MKQAVLIMAHNNFEQLKILIKLLDYEKFDIYLHIDKKSSYNKMDLQSCCTKSHIYIYSEFNIKWAYFSQTECELFLLKKAISNDNYEYFHLISGLDLPLKTNKEIFDFFHSQKKEFVHFESSKISNHKLCFAKYYYPLLSISKYKNSKVLKGIDRLLLLLQKICMIDRIKKSNLIFYTGANWFSITNNFAEYLIKEEELIKHTFMNTRSSDEMFVQTILMNSPFKNNLYNEQFDNDYKSCMRFIDWQRGSPYTWTINEFDELKKSDYLFARKFDWNKDKEIILKIKDDIIGGNYE